MPGWGWILSSLAADCPAFFPIAACIAACVVWPEFRVADSGGDVAAFIDRVPREFTGHALR